MLDKISYFRCQPIMKIIDGEIKAYAHEVLVKLDGIMPNSLEQFFNELPISDYIDLFKLQINVFRKMNGTYFINVPAKLMLSDDFNNFVISSGFDINKICIEIQDSYSLKEMSPYIDNLKNKIFSLQSRGVSVWLDDIDETFLDLAISLGVNGVKIDKSTLWNSENLLAISNDYRFYGIDVLAEGVEDLEHYNKVLGSSIHFAQGYLWPEIRVDLQNLN
ncbi:EAL domain-containing protein [Vibrio cholerae]|uniref:EAL domain-containing protein n=1 Tax=Vibrio cholerae TaxID=666 RepID=UPI001E2BC3CD|nr:EAL domain-containing protein [Vibrio cholerae]MCD6670943.1 EAL domain-containing protein [Vibrio cholerae]